MPTPTFSLRIPAHVQKNLAEMAKIYGAPNTRAFAAEVLTVMSGNDIEPVKAFIVRFIAKAGEQLTLQLSTVMDDATGSPKKAPKPKKKGKTTANGRKRA